MDKQLYNANDPSTLCTNIVNFGPVTNSLNLGIPCVKCVSFGLSL